MTYTFDEDCYSDLHKDAFGFRPGQGSWEMWNSSTPEEKQAEWDRLIEVMKRRCAEEEDMQRECITKFENVVAAVISAGAHDRETAVRWMFDGSDSNGDWGYYEYNLGVPYGYFKEFYEKEAA